jgi:peptidoglycan hydrolase CwlO-like protein
MEALEALVDDLRVAAENAEARGDRQVALYDLLYRLGKEVARERLVREQTLRLAQRQLADEQLHQRTDVRVWAAEHASLAGRVAALEQSMGQLAAEQAQTQEAVAEVRADVDTETERRDQSVERLASRVTSIRNDLSDDIRSLGYRVDDLERKAR